MCYTATTAIGSNPARRWSRTCKGNYRSFTGPRTANGLSARSRPRRSLPEQAMHMNVSLNLESSFATDLDAAKISYGLWPDPRSLKFIYFDAGGGHRSAATALRDVIGERFPHWHVDLVNLSSDILRPLDPVHRLTDAYNTEDIYNGILKRGWTYGFSAVLRATQKLIKIYTP